MVSWTVFNFECADPAARRELMDWFEETQPVTFPKDERSTFAEVHAEDGTTGADYAWVDRYLYLTVMGGGTLALEGATEHWDRMARAIFDGRTETATEVTLVLDTGRGEDGSGAGVEFSGLEGYGGQDVMYALAMDHQFRFRSYSSESPTNQITPHPYAFDHVTDVEAFVEEMSAATGVEPTEAGCEFLRNDPMADEERPETGDGDPVDAVHAVDPQSGEVDTHEDPEDVPEESDGSEDGLLDRFRRLLGG